MKISGRKDCHGFSVGTNLGEQFCEWSIGRKPNAKSQMKENLGHGTAWAKTDPLTGALTCHPGGPQRCGTQSAPGPNQRIHRMPWCWEWSQPIGFRMFLIQPVVIGSIVFLCCDGTRSIAQSWEPCHFASPPLALPWMPMAHLAVQNTEVVVEPGRQLMPPPNWQCKIIQQLAACASLCGLDWKGHASIPYIPLNGSVSHYIWERVGAVGERCARSQQFGSRGIGAGGKMLISNVTYWK